MESVPHAIELQHHGKKGAVIPRNLREIIGAITGTYNSVKTEVQNSWNKVYNLSDLSAQELENFTKAHDILVKALGDKEPITNNILIVDFCDKGNLGLFKGGTIAVCKETLGSLTAHNGILRVLVHEYAHNFGGDGEKEHVSTIERIWARIVESLIV